MGLGCTASGDHPHHPVVPGLVERVAALDHFPAEPAAEHPDLRNCHPGQRRTGFRITIPVEDGRRAVDDQPGCPGVLRVSTVLRPRARAVVPSGVTPGLSYFGEPPRADAPE